MCSSDKFNVRWNNYHTVLQLSFPKLLTNEHFVDVTLTCEGRSIRCHKMVLSACSSYFEQLLTESPCQHPIIFLKDMKFWEVEALVDFMYKGEVSVSQDKLASLVQAAESLQIKGLAGSQTQDSAERVTTKSVRDRLLSRTERKIDSPPPKRKRRTMTDDRKMLPANLPDLEMIPLPRASVPVAVLCKPEVNSNSQSETVNHSEEISEDTAPTLYPNSPTEEESDVFTAMKIKDENFSTNEDQEDGISNDDEGNEENMELIQMGQGDGINMADPLNTGAGPSSEDRPQGEFVGNYPTHLPFRTPHKSLSLDEKMGVIRLYEEDGLSVRKIAARVGASKSQVHHIITIKARVKEMWLSFMDAVEYK